MTRTMGAVSVVAGIALGFAGSRFVPEPVVAAQTSWQCKSWVFQRQADASEIGTWLGPAKTVQISTAGLSQAGMYSVVACKQ